MIYLIPNFEKERYGGFQNAVKTKQNIKLQMF